MENRDSLFAEAVPSGRAFWLRSVSVSALLVIPCFWQRRIQAGDLASHVYNAWLAQLIERGQAPGLYLVRQWNNVLFDVALAHLAQLLGFAAAEKVVVSACLLIFFWGVFALVRAVTERPPWYLTPCIAMLAYGYSFNMGFLNYYVSLGLACFSLALFWRSGGLRCFMGAAVIPLVLVAHPMGFLWLLGTLAYVKVRKRLPGWWRLVPPAAIAGGLVALRAHLAHHAQYQADWLQEPFYLFNGADQLVLYGERYIPLAMIVLACGVILFLVDGVSPGGNAIFWKAIRLPAELYLVAFCATSLLPENLKVPLYAGWIGLLATRLTTISAIFGLCVLGCLKPRRWPFAGFAACAVVFFVFLYQDSRVLNRMEQRAERLVSGLPPGTRVIPAIRAPAASRAQFIGHIVDRACVGHCFSYSNYEPSSGEFRIRVRPGSPVVTASNDDSEDMEGGEYEVKEEDLPLKLIYQCDESEPTKLCIRNLRAGEQTGQASDHPPNE